MDTKELKKKAERLIKQMRRDRGYLYPEWELAARMDPDFMEAYNALYRRALGEGQALNVKYRELIALALLAFRGEHEALVTHIRRAMKFGATKQEVLEAFEAAIIPGGALTFLRGLRALLQIEGEGKSRAESR
ncbi:MAG: carboxymuconolactone decarboxylase family protein [candidate division NC10 bacterium]|nr:carboxymuconolactone decarboxylase family protein [candidate division NC10 bacterium]